MSDLPGLLAIAEDNTVSEVRLSPNTLAVLLYALGKIDDWQQWTDYRGEQIPQADIETIHDLVDQASFEVMNPIMTIPVGATMTWHLPTPPDRWLFCNGDYALKADYPELWALWGETFGGALTDFFALLDMRDKSPMGQSASLALNATSGAMTHTLTTSEIPSHTHAAANGGNYMVNGGTGAKTHQPAAGALANYQALTAPTGGGTAHNNLHPVRGVNWIVYAGLP